MESLRSDGSATYLFIIWVEKIIPLAMKSKQKPYPSIVFLSIYAAVAQWLCYLIAKTKVSGSNSTNFLFWSEKAIF